MTLTPPDGGAHLSHTLDNHMKTQEDARIKLDHMVYKWTVVAVIFKVSYTCTFYLNYVSYHASGK